MKIVIVGAGGRLGAMLARKWAAQGEEIRGFTHAELDLTSADAIQEKLAWLDFDVLVNCAALTNVDYCETHAEEAHAVNCAAVQSLGELCAQKRRRCLHISTDYVFDGAKRTPYLEEDEARPISVYGASKRAGETALLQASEKHLVARVSWVFGPDRPSFVDAILKRALQEEQVDAIADKIAVPTYTHDAAQWLYPLLSDLPIGGLLHICQSGECSWQQYGQHAIDCALSAGIPLKARTVSPLAMADLKSFVARRPPYTAMFTARLTQLTGVTPRPWQAAVEEYVRTHWASGPPGVS